MQINEKNVDGLKHTFEVVVPSKTIELKIDARLQEVGKGLKIPGFRPGKVPLSILKQRYEAGIRKEVLEKIISESSQGVIKEKKITAATPPHYDIQKYDIGGDLTFIMVVETLPKIEPADLSKVSFERLKVKITEADIDEALKQIAKGHKRTKPVEKPRKAKKNDTLIIDFKGWQGDAPIKEGESKNFRLELGSGSLIPGFEDQLIGAMVGDKIEVNVTFPTNYSETSLAGKPSRFEVTVKEHHEPCPVKVDDELAKDYNLPDLKALREDMKKELEDQFSQSAFLLTKRAVLDRLAEDHTFPVPESMVSNEFEMIWKQAQNEFEQEDKESPKKLGSHDLKKQEELFKTIAERRVRLGLLLAEIGRKNNITVSQAEFQKALTEEAMKYRSHAKKAFEYFHKNLEARAQIHAPLYENKVIMFILETSKSSEREISCKEFNKELEKLEESIN